MTLTIEKIYQIPETVPMWSEIKDWDGEYVSPTTAKVTLYDPLGTALFTDEDMTESETGKFVYYYYTEVGVDTAGWHVYVITITDGEGDTAKVTVTRGGFRLE